MAESKPLIQMTRFMPRGSFKAAGTALIAVVLALVLYLVLPFESDVNKGLALLLFVAICGLVRWCIFLLQLL